MQAMEQVAIAAEQAARAAKQAARATEKVTGRSRNRVCEEREISKAITTVQDLTWEVDRLSHMIVLSKFL